MQWLVTNPFFVSLLPAAALPILFHFFLRFRTRPAVFSTLMFFDAIDPRMRARRRIHEWLVLLLRCLFLALLLAALARPVWMGGHGRGRTATVLIIDNSGSMSGGFSAEMTRLRAAVDAARGMVGRMGSDDVTGVVVCVDDPTVSLPAELTGDKGMIRSSLDRIVETEAGADPAWALRRALGMLDAGSAAARAVHIFTDLQEIEWGKTIAELPAPGTATSVFVHRIPAMAPKKPNLSLAGISPMAGRILAGRSVVFSARISNPGTKPASAVLHWMDDAGAKKTESVSVEGGAEKSVPLVLRGGGPGWHWAYAWLQDDGFAGDNRCGIGFECADKVSALLVGAGTDFGMLPLALSPSADGQLSGIRVELAAPTDLEAKIATLKPSLIVLPFTLLDERSAAIRAHVQQGGNVLLFPGDASGVTLPEWTGVDVGRLDAATEGVGMTALSKNSVLLSDLNEADGPILAGAKAFRFHALAPGDAGDAVIGLDDGRVLLAAHREGEGFVFTSGLGFDPSWSTLPLKGAFLAIAQRMAVSSGAATSISAIVAGDRTRNPFEGLKIVNVKSLAGGAFEWKGEGSAVPAFPRASVLSVKSGDRSAIVGVRSSEREGVARYVKGGRVPALGAIPHKVKELGDVHDFVESIADERRDVDLYPFLLALAILCLLAETWLANTRWRAKERSGVEARRPELAGEVT